MRAVLLILKVIGEVVIVGVYKPGVEGNSNEKYFWLILRVLLPLQKVKYILQSWGVNKRCSKLDVNVVENT